MESVEGLSESNIGFLSSPGAGRRAFSGYFPSDPWSSRLSTFQFPRPTPRRRLRSSFGHIPTRPDVGATGARVRSRQMQEFGVCPDGPRDGPAEEITLGHRNLVDVLLVLLCRAFRQMEFEYVAVSERLVEN